MAELDIGEFSGSDYVPLFDNKRLTGQIKRIYSCMSDGKWRTLSEIEEVTGDGQSSISAQLRNLRKADFGTHNVDKRRRGDRTEGLFEYKLELPLPDPREWKQKEVLDIYLKSGVRRGTMILPTGFGKSKFAIDVINIRKPRKVVILVNSTDLRDYSWKDEFNNFGMGWFFDKNVIVFTYQAAHKWTIDQMKLDGYLIIADEVDFAANVEEYSKVFYTYPDVDILGLTGFVTEDKKEWFAEYLPVVHEYTMIEAQEDGILNKMHFIFVKYEIGKVKDRVVKYKKAGRDMEFKSSENSEYEYADNKFNSYIGAKEGLFVKYGNGEINQQELDSDINRLDYLIKRISTVRKEILLTSNSSKIVVNKVLTTIEKKRKDSKTIIFSVLTSQSAKLCEYTYNGKNSAKTNKDIFQKFNSGIISILGVCSKINRGVNIKRLTSAIFESFYGSDTQANQRLGRLARLNPGDTSDIYILLPYYRRQNVHGEYVLKETQQIKWAKNMLSNTVVTSHETIDYRSI